MRLFLPYSLLLLIRIDTMALSFIIPHFYLTCIVFFVTVVATSFFQAQFMCLVFSYTSKMYLYESNQNS